MCPNICRSYQKIAMLIKGPKNNKSKKIKFGILGFLSLLSFNFNIRAQVTGTLSATALAQRNAVIGQVSAGAAQMGAIAKFENFVITMPTPTAITPAMLNNTAFWTPQTIVGAGIFFEELKKITATNFVPSLAYLGADGALAAIQAGKNFVSSKYSAFLTANPVLAPLVSTVVSANPTYPELSLDAVSGLLNKTTAYCTVLEGATGANFSWQGATCTSDSQCCDGQVCIIDSTVNLGLASDNKTVYGACDTPPAPPCAKMNAACTGSGAGNCCQTPVTLTCDTSNSCKIPAGQACTPGNKDCEAGAICEPNVSAPTTGICKMSLGQPCSGAAGCVTGTSCGNVPAFGSNAALTNVCSIALNDSCAGTRALYCQTGSICDISASTCVAAGQIKTGDSGCFANSDCISGGCSVAGGVTPGVCQCVPAAKCTQDTDCCVGTGSCDLTTSKCVLNAVGIPGSTYDAQGNLIKGKEGDQCYSDGVTAIPAPPATGGIVYPASVCVTGQTCQVTQEGTPYNFCQACGYGAVNSGTAQAPVYQAPDGCDNNSNCCDGSICSNWACCNLTGGYCQVATQSQDCCSGTCNNGKCA